MSHWWLDKPMRLVQTNLREIDATLDVDALFGGLREFSANVLLFNVGGIVANYPTGIECHFPNPYLQGDLVGEVTERCREEGIRFIARYDFSKVNHEYARNNLEWLYVGTSGNTVDYNGQVQPLPAEALPANSRGVHRALSHRRGILQHDRVCHDRLLRHLSWHMSVRQLSGALSRFLR